MPFFQDPPRLTNQYDDDRVLRSFLARKLPDETLRAVEPSLREMGALSAGPLYDLLLAEHATWALETERDARPAHAARRLSRLHVDRIDDGSSLAEARGLGRDEPAPFA